MTLNNPYIYLTPIDSEPRTSLVEMYTRDLPLSVLKEILEELEDDDVLHLDLETTGLYAHDETLDVVGIGIANCSAIRYFDTRDFTKEHWEAILQKLCTTGWVAFNTTFDGAWLYRKAQDVGFPCHDILTAVQGCSLTLYRGLANEGYAGRPSSLEYVQENFLQWTSINKHWLRDTLNKYGISKGNMYKLADLDWEGFALYCALDAEASFQIWQELYKQLHENGHETKWAYHLHEEREQIKELIIQQFGGLPVDREKLIKHSDNLTARIEELEKQFLTHTSVAPVVAKWEDIEYQKAEEKRKPRTKRIYARKSDSPWLNYNINAPSQGAWYLDKELKCYHKWEEEFGGRFYKEKIKMPPPVDRSKLPKFNMNSNKQLIYLFYENLYNYKLKEGVYNFVELDLGNRVVDLDLTVGGSLPIGSSVYPLLGEPGKILGKQRALIKELGYVTKVLTVSEPDGKIHPQFIPYGTMTGRLAGSGGINLQQSVKTKEYLSCLIPRPGYMFVDIDITALEMVVQAEFSGDKTMMELYATPGVCHDVYLWWAMHIHPDNTFRRQLQAEYKPIPEVIEALKKKYKPQRTFMKPIVLGFSYNMRAKKLHKTLKLQGHTTTRDECYTIYEKYWEKLSGIKAWEERLLEERSRNHGWILNGFDHPISVPDDYTKDIVNRFTQNTGHCVLMKLNCHILQLIKERGIKTERPIIQDFHDERISEVREDEAQALVEVFNEGIVRLNEELTPNIEFQGTAELGTSIWDFKK